MTTRFSFGLMAVALGFTPLSLPGEAGDWPHWRGPQREAICTETGLLTTWPEDGPPLLWKMKGLGKGYASLSIVGGRAYTMGAREAGNWLIAIDLATQKELWATKVGGKAKEPRCTPTVNDGLVYALDENGAFLCADAATGQEKWRKDYAEDFGGKMMSGWGYCESPLIDGEKLLITPGGDEAALVALNKKTGAVLWKAAVPGCGGAGYTCPAISEAGGVRQYITLTGNALISVDAATGQLLWSYGKVTNGTANIPTPLVHGDQVFASTGYGTGAVLIDIKKAAKSESTVGDKPQVDPAKVAAAAAEVAVIEKEVKALRDARQKFERGSAEFEAADEKVQAGKATLKKAEEVLNAARGKVGGDKEGLSNEPSSPVEAREVYFLDSKTFQNHHGGMVRLGEHIFAGHGHNNGFPICLDWKSGKVVWGDERHSKGKESAALLAAGDTLIYRYQNGITALVAASTAGYKELGCFKEAEGGGARWAHPVIHQGRLLLRTQEWLMCYDVKGK